MKIAIIGATGLVGRELLAIAAAQDELDCDFGLYASAESAGQRIAYKGTELTLAALADCDFSGYDAAFFCIGDELSAEYVPQALAAGCLVVDKSNAFRMQPDVPLVVGGVNDGAVTSATKLVANPNCSTIILTHALAPWAQFGLKRVWVATYQSVSGAGKGGVEQLAQGAAAQPMAAGTLPRPGWDSRGFAHNVIPAVGGMDSSGRCSEETKLIQETRKVLALPGVHVTAHAARVPVLIGHSMAVTVEFELPATAALLQEAWAESEYIRQLDGAVPTPLSAMHHEQVEVGRLRAEEGGEHAWSFFASGDNLNLGAALNGWRILLLLAEQAGQLQHSEGGN